jgi:Secretion system C-terminal sorting domain
MKAKLLLATALLLAFFGTATAQYHPFLNNSSWIVNDWVSCCMPPEVHTIQEGTATVIGDYTYTMFNDPFPTQDSGAVIPTVYLREDVAAQKVYKRVDGVDTLLYDFSLENGDTVSQYGFTFTATVDQIAVNDGVRKRITLRSVELYHDEQLKQIWIEGVGTTAHPFYPERNMYVVASSGGGYQIRTRCSFQNGEHVFGNANCAPSSALSTTSETTLESNITFTPNPMVTQLTISSTLELQNATLRLYNAQGQLVRETANLNGKSLVVNRDNLAAGLYVAQLFKDGKLLKTAKFIVD